MPLARAGQQLDQPGTARGAHGPGVPAGGDLLHAGNGPDGEEVEQGRRVVRLAAGQPQREPGPRPVRGLARAAARPAGRRAQLRRGAAGGLQDGGVELPDAGEAAGERDVGDRQAGLGQQPPRRLQPDRPGQGQRPGAQLGHEQPVQVPLRDGEPRGQPADAMLVHVARGDQPHRPGGQVGAGVPLRRPRAGLGAAAAAGPEPGRLGRPGMREEPHVRPGRGARRADRPAVDPGAGHRGEEPPVEPRVTGQHRPVAGVEVQRHALIQPQAAARAGGNRT